MNRFESVQRWKRVIERCMQRKNRFSLLSFLLLFLNDYSSLKFIVKNRLFKREESREKIVGAFSSESSFSFLFSLFLRESSRSYLGDIPIFHPFSPPFDMLSNRVRQLASVSFFPRKNMERKNMRRENYSLVSSILSLSFLSNASKSSQLLKRIHLVGSISSIHLSFFLFFPSRNRQSKRIPSA